MPRRKALVAPLAVLLACCQRTSSNDDWTARAPSAASAGVLQSPQPAAQAERPSGEPTQADRDRAGALQESFDKIYKRHVLPLLTPEEAAKVKKVEGPIVNPRLLALTEIFVDLPGQTPRQIVIGLGGARWCNIVARAWLVEIARVETEPLFIQDYMLYLRRVLAKPTGEVGLDPYTVAGWRAGDLNDGQKEDALLFVRSIAIFVLAHEVGHVVLDHGPPADAEASRVQELAADRFACELCERQARQVSGSLKFSGIGMFLYCSAMALDPVAGRPGSSGHPPGWERVGEVARFFLEHERELGLTGQERDGIAAILKSCEQANLDPDGYSKALDEAAGRVDPASLRRTRTTDRDP